ncbi:Rab proteins geranylgeranyltransferase component A [Orbilia ellipsospora]|uniref:Rab proteins geranylgeranyltransferase component A n=1 Tax=Orbilia ellipsospora TaxID=2528407 RepID=A0AAV9X1I9_9PEZI
MNIQSLDKTTWDAVIVGTGLRESLLAAALARAGKRVLHLDKNPYYGDEYAAFSGNEFETWVKNAQAAGLQVVDYFVVDQSESSIKAKSRSYTLNLSPGLLYTTSPLLSLLVASNLNESLEFLKVGGWFVYNPSQGIDGSLVSVPNSREDVFNDQTLDARSKRLVVRALKSILGLEGSPSANSSAHQSSLKDYLEQPSFRLPNQTIAAFASLTLRHDRLSEIPFEEAERDIRRHFGSIGRFGPGFAAVVSRYGSGSELVQVFCRAAAVTGNAIYMLENTIISIQGRAPRPNWKAEEGHKSAENTRSQGFQLRLQSGDLVWAENLIATKHNLPIDTTPLGDLPVSIAEDAFWTSLYIVSNPLRSIFRTNEPPAPAGVVVYIPSGSLAEDESRNSYPIYICIHSSETGECPDGQCIMYISTKGDERKFLDVAAKSLLRKMPREDGSPSQILMSVKFKTLVESPLAERRTDGLHLLANHGPLIEIQDEIVDQVIDIYDSIVGSRETFMEKLESEDPGDVRDDTEISFEGAS